MTSVDATSIEETVIAGAYLSARYQNVTYPKSNTIVRIIQKYWTPVRLIVLDKIFGIEKYLIFLSIFKKIIQRMLPGGKREAGMTSFLDVSHLAILM